LYYLAEIVRILNLASAQVHQISPLAVLPELVPYFDTDNRLVVDYSVYNLQAGNLVKIGDIQNNVVTMNLVIPIFVGSTEAIPQITGLQIGYTIVTNDISVLGFPINGLD
jgi:hypothetical protein